MVWWAVPNGGPRDLITAVNLKRNGVRAGVSDLIFLHLGRAFALELKADTNKNRPSEEQMQFISDFNAAGGFACSAKGL